jgi:putative transposase
VPHVSHLRHGTSSRSGDGLSLSKPRIFDLSYDVNMTKGLVRYQQAGHLHFVTFSCYRRQPHLGSAPARGTFERSLEAMRVRYDFFVAGYVVMPVHVHLLISEPKQCQLAKALQALKLSVAVQRSERPFLQARYYDFNVHSERKRGEKLIYIHRNPVTRGQVTEPEEWAWSSFRHCWTGEPGVVEIKSTWTAARGDRAAMKTHVSNARHGAPAVGEAF